MRFILTLFFWYLLYKFIKFMITIIFAAVKFNKSYSNYNKEQTVEEEETTVIMDDVSEIVDAKFEEIE